MLKKIELTGNRSGLRMISMALFGIVLGVGTLAAQDTPATQPPPAQQGGPGQGPGGRPGPERMQQRQLDMLTTQLNLTPDQVTQVKAVQADTRQQMMALREDTSTAQQDKQAKMMAIRKGSEEKIRGVLTDDQKTKFDAMQARMQQRRESREGGPGAPAPAAPAGQTPPAPPQS